MLVENSASDIARIAADGRILDAAPSSEGRGALGYETADFLGHSIFELIHPDDTDRAREILTDLGATPGANVNPSDKDRLVNTGQATRGYRTGEAWAHSTADGTAADPCVALRPVLSVTRFDQLSVTTPHLGRGACPGRDAHRLRRGAHLYGPRRWSLLTTGLAAFLVGVVGAFVTQAAQGLRR
jgi:hypothetical protein